MSSNTLQESQSANQPDKETVAKLSPAPAVKEGGPHTSSRKPKTPLRKDELEKIAQELKKKLSQASVAAKQSLTATAAGNPTRQLPPDSPVSQTSLPKSSPLKNYYMWRRQIASGGQKSLVSSPNLYSPGRASPTSTKPSIFLSSSPLKTFAADENRLAHTPSSAGRSRAGSVDSEAYTEPNDSPIKRRRADSGAVIKPREPHMVLQPISAAATATAATVQASAPQKEAKEQQKPSPKIREELHPSPVLSVNPPPPERSPAKKKTQTTPTLARKQLAPTSHSVLLKTPTQQGRGDAYNDEEGADLLMYLATSPQVPKSYGHGTGTGTGHGTGAGIMPRRPSTSSAAPYNSAFSNPVPMATKSHSAGNQFMAPPLTPKRTAVSMAKTPQNRLTPMFYGNGGANLAVPGSALPSAGLALTPAGFNMNDYVNFFTPSPGGAGAGIGGSGHPSHGQNGRTLLKTPDFHGQLHRMSQTPVDGKMINFDKAELFGSAGPESSKD